MKSWKPKVRKRDYTKDVHDVQDLDVDFEQVESTKITKVKFNHNEADIVLDRKITYILTPNNCFLDAIATNLLMSPDYWHSITVHHQGAFSKEEIQQGLDDFASNFYFIPVKYVYGKNENSFYIHNQSAALHSMLKKNLETFISNRRLGLTLKLGVASYTHGQINPAEKIDLAIEDVFSRFREQKLDFSHFSSERLLVDIKFSMHSKANFELFCNKLLANLFREKYKDVVNNLKILVLVKNNIKYLEPLNRFIRCKHITNISLRHNLIESIDEFKALEHLKLKMLSVAGNPFTKIEHAADKILKILNSLEKLDIKKVKMADVQEQQHKEAILLPSTSASEEIVRAENINEDVKNEFPLKEYTKSHWSDIFIEHKGKFDGKDVLDEMFKVFFEEIPCYPCYYRTGPLEDSFKLWNNFEPMNILVQNNLRIKMPGTNEFVTFRLHLKSSPIHNTDAKWIDVVSKAIEKRITGMKLNLKCFRDDPELRNTIVNMTSLDIKQYIVYSAINKNLKIMEIDLSHNKIKSLKGFEYIKKFKELISLHISNNNIESLNNFPEDLNIVELSLQNNPVCNTFKNLSKTPYDYVTVLSKLCPNLQYIDGRKIDKDFKMIHLHNFYITPVAYPAIESFINLFFSSFDYYESRKNLAYSLYNTSSMLTEASSKSTIIGSAAIDEYFGQFPHTEHDFITMTVDTPLFNTNNIIIVVNGVFKQKFFETNSTDKLFTFSRTFMLKPKRYGDGRPVRTIGTLSWTFNFEIQNELFVFDVLNDHRIKNKAFRKQRATEDDFERVIDGKYDSKTQFIANVEMFRQITFLKDVWCTRLLEDAHGNFEVALNNFLKFYQIGMFKRGDFMLK